MCTVKRPINAKPPKDKNKSWRIPKQVREKQARGELTKLLVRCGKCYECKKERARNWTYKIFLEALEHEEKCFITLTYKEAPPSLIKKHLQDFIKRLRKKTGAYIKYFGAGEYGETKTQRPHYHLIVLGWTPSDLKKVHSTKSKKGHDMYFSDTVKNLWGKGRITVQRFHYNEIAYLTLYTDTNQHIDDTMEEERNMHKHNVRELKEKMQIVSLKDSSKSKQKLYRRRYQTILSRAKELREQYREKEFNVWSKGLGWDVFLRKEYWKYDLIINGFFFEIPKEFIRKVFDRKRNLPKEVVKSIYKVQKERVEIAEKQYEEITAISVMQQEREAQSRVEANKNQIRLHKRFANGF